MDIIYRIGTNADKKGLQALGLISYGSFKATLTIEHWEKMNIFLKNIDFYTHLLKISTCFVATVNDKIVGMAFFVPNGNPTDIFQTDWSYIRMVGVDPRYSGNQIGEKLTHLCLEKARTTNEKIVALHTSEIMDTARYIYEKIGFKKIKEIAPAFGKKYWLYQLKL